MSNNEKRLISKGILIFSGIAALFSLIIFSFTGLLFFFGLFLISLHFYKLYDSFESIEIPKNFNNNSEDILAIRNQQKHLFDRVEESKPIRVMRPESKKGVIEELDNNKNQLDYFKRLNKSFSGYPIVTKPLNNIIIYLSKFKEKDFRINQYILNVTTDILETFKDVIDTPYKDSDKGKELIDKTGKALALIEQTLESIYGDMIGGNSMEIDNTIEALQNKLAMDGYIESKYDINNFKVS